MATTSLPHNPYAVISCLTPEVSTVYAEYLESPFTFGEVLENKPVPLCQQVCTELALYFDIRDCNGQLELYFKKEQ